jgi:hypothetical protein
MVLVWANTQGDRVLVCPRVARECHDETTTAQASILTTNRGSDGR